MYSLITLCSSFGGQEMTRSLKRVSKRREAINRNVNRPKEKRCLKEPASFSSRV
jgi:hypothetical protein